MAIYITPIVRRPQRRWMDRFEQNNNMVDTLPGEVIVPVDVVAEPEGYTLTALIPGVKAEDLNIQIVNETVSIQGELGPAADKGTDYLMRELPYGRFNRVLTLPAGLDSANTEATIENGVLTLRIPKAETARPKKIKVNIK